MFVTVTGEILNAGDGKRAWSGMAMTAVCGSDFSLYIYEFLSRFAMMPVGVRGVSSTHH